MTALSAAAIDSLPSKGIPDRFRVRLDGGSVTEPISGSDRPKVGDGPSSAPGFDPGGGNDGQWWSVVWSGRDLSGTYVPLRLGDSRLGYRHYSGRHNLTSLEPWKAVLKSRGPDAKSNYTALLVDRNLGVRETVIFGVQLSTRTNDREYETPDGAYIGVITGYCKGKTKCPSAVNRVKAG
ncbi:hypothetical protein [Micromonospora sp. NPDC049497]|uniref:hypothetical protein n=1 Tax=Micromonospora sp. NPDC049497 TaxID=3364273 RepID=UPI0037A22A1D